MSTIEMSFLNKSAKTGSQNECQKTVTGAEKTQTFLHYEHSQAINAKDFEADPTHRIESEMDLFALEDDSSEDDSSEDDSIRAPSPELEEKSADVDAINDDD